MSQRRSPETRSFVEVAPESHFPIENLPYGVFAGPVSDAPRIGVAIGDFVLDLALLEARGLFDGPWLRDQRAFRQPTLNAFLALGPAAWMEARARITHLLSADTPTLRDDRTLREAALVPTAAARMCLPCAIGDYSDFYASRHHALNVGRIFRGPDAALPAAYLHLPIGYHGRASSIVVSGSAVRRPAGQCCGSDDEPQLSLTRELDFELEVGLLVGPGNALGCPIPIAQAWEHIFGLVLVNDWSARDIQQWEYVPLGPFLGKNFATTISPWVVPIAALESFRCLGPPQDPPPLPYLQNPGAHALDIHLEVGLQSARMTAPHVISRTNFKELYWTLPQMVAHHTIGGCNLRPGDLLATGTISGPKPDSLGSLLELTRRGERPVRLPTGEQRVFLEDGDTVVLTGWAQGCDYRVGFGECRGTIRAAE